MSITSFVLINLAIYLPFHLFEEAVGAVLLFVCSDKLACFGIAILIWGIVNFGDHFFYTVKDKRVSPGLITGTLFLLNSICGLRIYVLSDIFSAYQLLFGIFIGGALFGLPIGLCVVFYPLFDKYFK